MVGYILIRRLRRGKSSTCPRWVKKFPLVRLSWCSMPQEHHLSKVSSVQVVSSLTPRQTGPDRSTTWLKPNLCKASRPLSSPRLSSGT